LIRIGHGYDVHAFGGDKPLILGGLVFKDHQGLIAHSDGDVLLHAICDSLLGAASLRDIGYHFPDTDKQYANANSLTLLSQVLLLLQTKNYKINNLDITVIAQTPIMSDHIENITDNICRTLSINIEQCNVKATTTEHLGYIGRKEGIAVHCVCLIEC
jgi:2-C-methyl-D-erythritol 2,4-cyclodiphosphate synthase